MQDIIYKIIVSICVAVLLPCLAYTAKSLIAYLKAQADGIKNTTLREAVQEAIELVWKSVVYVNQTYVDSLKSSGKFDVDAQREAFKRASDAAYSMINDELQKTIEERYGNFGLWLTTQIEQTVNEAKKAD